MPLLDAPAELRQGDDRHFQLTGNLLERTRDFRDLLLTVLTWLATTVNELQIVNKDHTKTLLLLQSPAFRPDIRYSNAWCIININLRF
ncbi:hypothetical protein D3C81_1244590 [compost metagenome]